MSSSVTIDEILAQVASGFNIDETVSTPKFSLSSKVKCSPDAGPDMDTSGFNGTNVASEIPTDEAPSKVLSGFATGKKSFKTSRKNLTNVDDEATEEPPTKRTRRIRKVIQASPIDDDSNHSQDFVDSDHVSNASEEFTGADVKSKTKPGRTKMTEDTVEKVKTSKSRGGDDDSTKRHSRLEALASKRRGDSDRKKIRRTSGGAAAGAPSSKLVRGGFVIPKKQHAIVTSDHLKQEELDRKRTLGSTSLGVSRPVGGGVVDHSGADRSVLSKLEPKFRREESTYRDSAMKWPSSTGRGGAAGGYQQAKNISISGRGRGAGPAVGVGSDPSVVGVSL